MCCLCMPSPQVASLCAVRDTEIIALISVAETEASEASLAVRREAGAGQRMAAAATKACAAASEGSEALKADIEAHVAAACAKLEKKGADFVSHFWGGEKFQ